MSITVRCHHSNSVNSPLQAAWENDQYKSPAGWPRQGSIKVENLSLRYREGLDLVLRDISFEIKPEEKVFSEQCSPLVRSELQ